MNYRDVPNREIGDEEDELLDQMWHTLSTHRNDGESSFIEREYNILQQHIRRIELRRRILRWAYSGAMAIALIAVVAYVVVPMYSPKADVYARLEEMGVSIDRKEVVMSADNGINIQLGEAAQLQKGETGEIALHNADGTTIALKAAKQLKVEVPDGRKFSLTLADGTRVWLNAGSVLEYPASFDGAQVRRVHLRGEAFFEVSPDETCKFCVELDNGERVEVLGTSFNVTAYTADSKHTTTLLTGKIRYTATENGQVVELVPNQQICLDRTCGKTDLSTVDAQSICAWTDGWLCFEQESLPVLAQRLSREYGIRICVDEHLQDYRFSGRIRNEHGIDYILNLVTKTTAIKCQINDGTMYLK